jgi:dTDP-4-dehydrorhamnose 3,5-epimerase
MLRVEPTSLPGVLVLEPRVFTDERGYFLESWNQQRFDEAIGRPARFVQDNHSRSAGGVLRGLHYQFAHPQEKLVRVVAGRVFDVAVDMRRSSPTLGHWVGVELSADNMRQLWVPAGFAHGFLVLSRYAELLYKTTDYYSPEHERTLAWNDRHVGVQWPLGDVPREPIVSPKDSAAPLWGACELFD